MPAEAKVGQFRGTKAERLLNAAENDVRSLQYALEKNAAAIAHHSEVKADLEAQIKAATATRDQRAKDVEAERAAAEAVRKAEESGGTPEGAA